MNKGSSKEGRRDEREPKDFEVRRKIKQKEDRKKEKREDISEKAARENAENHTG